MARSKRERESEKDKRCEDNKGQFDTNTDNN